MIDAGEVDVVVFQVLVVLRIVIAAFASAGSIRSGITGRDVPGDRIDTAGGDDVTGERLPAEATVGGGLGGTGIVDLIGRSEGE